MSFFTPDEELDAVSDLFFDAVESWFSSDIACCEHCYDDFIEQWPLAYFANNDEFQRKSIDMECLYSGSKIQEFFSKADFLRLITQISCPACGAMLGGSIWPYTLPFSIPNGFENEVHKISSIAKSTPFLILENDFAKRSLTAIRKIYSRTSAATFDSSLFRGRPLSGGPIKELASSFDFPPAHLVKEGRYNHSGIPVLYVGNSIETCLSELRNAPCKIIEFKFCTALKVLDLTKEYEDVEDISLLNALVFSALMSAKQDTDGWNKPEYVFSRFIADCAKSVGFDAIKYPSTRRGSASYNLVILNCEISIQKNNNAEVIAFHQR